MSLIQKCPHFWGQGLNREILLYAEVSCVLISGSWNKGVPLYTEVSSFQVVGIEEFHCIQRCPHFRWFE